MMECIFCDIANGKGTAQCVYQDESVIGFRDVKPRAPVHILLIPRKHISKLADLTRADEQIVGHIFYVGSCLAREFKIADSGFRMVVNSGPDAGQTVYHLHFHLLGGRSFAWPPG